MKATPSEMRLSFCLDTNAGKPYCATDKQIDKMWAEVPFYESIEIMPAHGYFLIVRIPYDSFNNELVWSIKSKIETICKHSRGER